MDVRDYIIAIARSVIGLPYLWGGADPGNGFDCSGLVQWVYRHIGINLPRTAQLQYDATVPVEEPQPGDLVFFKDTYKQDPAEPITHVAIYAGNGQMINAPSEGQRVRVEPITGYWAQHLAGYRRPAALQTDAPAPPAPAPGPAIPGLPQLPALPDLTSRDLWARVVLALVGIALIAIGAWGMVA
jgi:hypothetical protein